MASDKESRQRLEGETVSSIEGKTPSWPARDGCRVGERIDGFEILQVLGEGSFATVFLARELSLDRNVALKVSSDVGEEARTLASLDHDHVVKVFSETVDWPTRRRFICMQYVPGATLAAVLDRLKEKKLRHLTGASFLDAIDQLSTGPALLDPVALRDRERLKDCGYFEAVAWLGARVAEALSYAHGCDVLHRDIKPANILLTPYGRPLLADFNLSVRRVSEDGSSRVGGTIAYMAPEQIYALNPKRLTNPTTVDARSDLYSLGLVLFELLTHKPPFGLSSFDVLDADGLDTVAKTRRQGDRSARSVHPLVPEALDRTVRRCLHPDPSRRFQDASTLAKELAGCGELERIGRELPRPGALTRLATKRPFFSLVLLGVLPNLLGSVVNISYNSLQVVGRLDVPEERVFSCLVLTYNAIVYPLCLVLAFFLIRPIFRAVRSLDRLDTLAVDRGRQRAISLPWRAAQLACLGWFPGSLFFPLGLHVFCGPIPLTTFGHFFISFAISGLVASTYSYFGILFVSLRVLYLRLWSEVREISKRASRELRLLESRLRLFQFMAGIIPLGGACLMVLFGPNGTPGSASFRLLALLLILLGMLGFQMALSASRLMLEVQAAIVGTKHRRF